jgi:hypothetical protein
VDIALIAVHGLNAEVATYEYDDFEFIDDFHTYNFDGVNLQVFGFPERLQQETQTDFFYSWMSYVTIACFEPQATKDFLFCHYPMNAPVLESYTLDRTALPAARGLSGAFILKVPASASQSALIWSPTTAKVIAIQIAWDKKNYIKCSNVVHLKTLLDNAKIR